MKDRLFLKQHDANWIRTGYAGAGNILVHNNNTVLKPRRPPPPGGAPGAGRPSAPDSTRPVVEAERGTSNICELKLPDPVDGAWHPGEDGRFGAETVSLWQDERYFADFQGGARRLSNGNTLLTDTTDYLVVEVDAKGNIVAEYKGVAPVYKAFKYNVADFPDFLGRFSPR